MKKLLTTLFLCTTCITAYSANPDSPLDALSGITTQADKTNKETEKLIKKLRSGTHIGSSNIIDSRNDNKDKEFSLKFTTNQRTQDNRSLQMRITIEVWDADKNLYYGQVVWPQGALVHSYNGQDDWEFKVTAAGLEKPKVTAYTIEYGDIFDGKFVALDEQFKRVDSADEITSRGKNTLKITCKHTQWYIGS